MLAAVIEEAKTQYRQGVEALIKRRLNKSIRVQRGLAALGLVAGLYAGAQDNAAVSYSVSLGAASAGVAGAIERHKASRKCDQYIAEYRYYIRISTGQTPGEAKKLKVYKMDENNFVSCDKEDPKAQVSFNALTVAWTPLFMRFGSALVMEASKNQATHVAYVGGSAFLAVAAAAHARAEITTYQTEQSYLRQLDNIDGVNITVE